MSSENQIRKLYVKLATYQRPIKPSKLYSTLYFSFKFLNKEYFSSSVLTSGQQVKNTSQINDHFVFSFDNLTNQGELLQIMRWQNHSPVFTFQIELSELLNKQFCRKRLQTKPQEYLNLAISILEDHELQLLDRKTNEIAHYYCIDQMQFTKMNRDSEPIRTTEPSYLCISAGKKQFCIPEAAQSKCIVLQLPEKLMFQYYLGNTLFAQSEILDSEELLKKSVKVGLTSNRIRTGVVEFQGRWGYNNSSCNQINTLNDINQLSMYDFQVVFDKDSQYPDSKLKIIYGNKVYQLAYDNISGKKMKFRKLLTLILKPQDEEITFKMEKNHIEFCSTKVFTDELHQCQTVRKKLNEGNGKQQLGTIRFRSQKAKTLSLPENNRLWRELLKNRIKYNYILSIEQISYYLEPNSETSPQSSRLNITMGNLKTPIDNVICLTPYNLNNLGQLATQQAVEFQIRQQSAVYITFQNESKITDDNVEGMAVVDLSELRLGLNAIQVPLFRNQKLASHVNMIINKIPNMQIVKPGYQPQIMAKLKKKIRSVSIDVRSTLLNSYFYTFQYENKNELYCIVEINRIKKVLLLDRQSIEGLSFIQGEGSDYLNFTVEQAENLRVKLTFLIADLGAEQEIYGTVIFKCRFSDLTTGGSITFAQTNIKNDYDIIVGSVSVSVNVADGLARKSQPSETQAQVVKTERITRKVRAQKSVEARSIKNLSLDNGSNRYASIDAKESQRYDRYSLKENPIFVIHEVPQAVRLPALPARGVKQNLYNDSIKALVQKAKKQSWPKQDANMDDTISKLEREVQINKKKIAQTKAQKNRISRDTRPPIALREELSLSNPNLDRKFELLFPTKMNKLKKTELRKQIVLFEQKLRGLKSVLNEIQDVTEVQPETHDQTKKVEPAPTNTVEFQDNEFMGEPAQLPPPLPTIPQNNVEAP